MKFNLVTKDKFHVVGVKWQGTFQDADQGEIRKLMMAFKERIQDIPNVADADTIFGVTEDVTNEGFTYYVTVETKGIPDSVPQDMTHLTIGKHTYAVCQHRKGMNIEQTYEDLAKWYTAQGYELVPGERSFEIYSTQYHPLEEEPEFCVYSPVQPR